MGLCGGRSPAAGCRQPKAGAGQRLGGAWVGRAGVSGLGSLRWLCGLEEVKPRSPARVRLGVVGCDGLAGVFGFGSLWWLCGLEEVKAKSPAIAGWGVTKIPKIPKIPIALDDSGELKQLP